jgi:dephospho-CoA kinase
MIVIGLTGGVGMGKSTAAEILARRGLPVIDTDALARELVGPGQPALAEIRAAFGDSVFDQQGHLRRGNLAKIVFADPAKRQQLESILHPRIRESWLQQVSTWHSEEKPAAVVVIPLLFETNAQTHFHHILCVACSDATQRKRLAARGWTEEQINQRIASQLPTDDKITRSNFLIWTEPSLQIHEQQLGRILLSLSAL